ncbi:MAG: hypothetical protein ACLFVH_03130 [Phycisphaerae bacterium]
MNEHADTRRGVDRTIRPRSDLRAVALAGLLACAVWVAPAMAETVKLTYDDSSAAGKVITPAYVRRRLGRVKGGPTSSYVTIAEEKVPLKFGRRGRISFVGADSDGDGKIGAREICPITGGTARLKVRVNSAPLMITLVKVQLRTNEGKITSVDGMVKPACGRTGSLGGAKVSLIDQNLDGKITQDGSDAIRIGRSLIAQSLGKVHAIGGRHYRLAVGSDGNSIEADPISGEKLAVVKFALNSPSLKGLILQSDDGQVYDLVRSAKTGLLPGKYRLKFGMLVSGKNVVPILPRKDSLSYELKGGKLNTIRLGGPVRMQFGASYSDGKVTVGGMIYPVGDGGEEYIVSLGAGDGVPAPEIGFYEGKRRLAGGRMGYG